MKTEISDKLLVEIYNLIKTPYKHGAVVEISDKMCDSPTVFRFDGKWYMSFIEIDNQVESSGYDSHIAQSTDFTLIM